MKAVFKETRLFENCRSQYLSDDAYAELQKLMMSNPQAGKLIADSGGLRKLRFPDARRCKGKRGGLRIIYYFWNGESQFWLLTIYGKDEMDDLTAEQRKLFKRVLDAELMARKRS
ncbi:toxin [Herbaspirillum sp. AP02]|uniref:toxin n=1 Tax=unclassified Herbaspirillum TaxID=2624150 RepID=UPI0015DA4AA5|nr:MULTISPECIES: toxin [unclassified Herbaspirillum]MBG7621572.1 toxin [Herbaspirillum sp. AP02]NZD69660.1 toxin [Herbaspirillum sp. AP21]